MNNHLPSIMLNALILNNSMIWMDNSVVIHMLYKKKIKA